MNKKIDVTISIYLEISNAEIYGGKGSVGYAEAKIDLNTSSLDGFKLEEFVAGNIDGFAELLKVPGENIRIIPRFEYENSTNDTDNNRWIPVGERMPENAKHKGSFCPRYQVMTKFGVTEGWYNPDYESWYVLVWFMTERYLNSDIDFERGAHPKVVRCENKVNDRHSIVTAWRPLPEPYRPERSNNHDGK